MDLVAAGGRAGLLTGDFLSGRDASVVLAVVLVLECLRKDDDEDEDEDGVLAAAEGCAVAPREILVYRFRRRRRRPSARFTINGDGRAPGLQSRRPGDR